MKKIFLGIILLFFVLSLFTFNESVFMQKYNLRKKTDDMEGITWYHSKLTPKSNTNLLRRNDCFYLYIGKTEEGKVLLRLRVQAEPNGWIFFNRIIVKADDEKFRKEFDPLKRKTEIFHSPRRVEWYDKLITESYITMLEKITKAQKIAVRFSGDTKYHQMKIKKKRKQALLDVLNAYKELQKGFL